MNHTFWIPTGISIAVLGWNLYQQIRIEKLKAHNERANLVHRVQFEKEFDVYKTLWGKLIDLRNATGALRPLLEQVDPTKTELAIREEKIKNFSLAHDSCLATFDKNKPFYYQEVYDEVEKIIRISRKEAIDFEYLPKSDSDGWKQAKGNIEEITVSIENVCEIIRVRIDMMKVAN